MLKNIPKLKKALVVHSLVVLVHLVLGIVAVLKLDDSEIWGVVAAIYGFLALVIYPAASRSLVKNIEAEMLKKYGCKTKLVKVIVFGLYMCALNLLMIGLAAKDTFGLIMFLLASAAVYLLDIGTTLLRGATCMKEKIKWFWWKTKLFVQLVLLGIVISALPLLGIVAVLKRTNSEIWQTIAALTYVFSGVILGSAVRSLCNNLVKKLTNRYPAKRKMVVLGVWGTFIALFVCAVLSGVLGILYNQRYLEISWFLIVWAMICLDVRIKRD